MVAEQVYVQQPKVRPAGVSLRQWRLAALYERCSSAREALLQAGYSLAIAEGAAKRTFDTIGVQRARVAQEEMRQAKRDSATEIKRKAGARVSIALDGDTDPVYALNAWATASKVKADYPDEEQGLDDATMQTARDYISKVVQCTVDYIASKIVSDNMDVRSLLSPQAIDAIVLASESCELTQYPLSDVAPPAPALLPAKTKRAE